MNSKLIIVHITDVLHIVHINKSDDHAMNYSLSCKIHACPLRDALI